MMTSKLMRKLLPMVLVLLFLFAFSFPTSAQSIDLFQTDETTGWKPTGAYHMGEKFTTFKYATADVQNAYSPYVAAGIAMWGPEIVCAYSATSDEGIIEISTEEGVWVARARTEAYYSPSLHIAKWRMQISPARFNGKPYSGKVRAIAHELGHVYGLADVNKSDQIMYHTYSTTISVTNNDKQGMRVMTHAHTHNGSYPGTYEQLSGYSHIKWCTTCKAYSQLTCTYSDYHSGTTHYLVLNCACGKNRTDSWLCNGNPCVMPFSAPPSLEKE